VKFCRRCGAARAAGTAFCPACGQAFDLTPTAPPDSPQTQRRRRTVLISALSVAVIGLVAVAGVLLGSRSTPSHTQPHAAAASTTTPVSASPTRSERPTASPAVTTAPGFSELYKQDSAGVIRIETTACDGGGVGTGFLVGPDMVATVAHVVNGAASVVLRHGTTTTTGTVVGIDPGRELALVRSSVPLTGHVFTLAGTQPDVGVDVATIGYPLAGPESLSKGTVSGLDRPIHVETVSLTGLIQTDTPINPGNSGGPLLTADGTVVGLVEAKTVDAANIGYAVPASTAKSQLSSWQAAPAPVSNTPKCGSPTGPTGVQATVTDHSGSSDGPAIAQSFETYATGINTGNYTAAFAVLTPRSQMATGFDKFARGDASSYIVALDVASVTVAASGQDTAQVQFTSVQDPQLSGHGQACSSWQLTYTMVSSASGWLIDRAAVQPGSPAPC